MQGSIRVKLNKGFGPSQVVELQGFPATFWIVTKPGPNSELEDICFMANLLSYTVQCKGGLETNDIYGFYESSTEAHAVARRLLAG